MQQRHSFFVAVDDAFCTPCKRSWIHPSHESWIEINLGADIQVPFVASCRRPRQKSRLPPTLCYLHCPPRRLQLHPRSITIRELQRRAPTRISLHSKATTLDDLVNFSALDFKLHCQSPDLSRRPAANAKILPSPS